MSVVNLRIYSLHKYDKHGKIGGAIASTAAGSLIVAKMKFEKMGFDGAYAITNSLDSSKINVILKGGTTDVE